MDTISRENNNPSILPIAGAVVGALALVLSVVALVKISSLGKRVTDDLATVNGQVSSMQSSVQQATDSSNRASTSITNITKQVQGAFDQVTAEIGNLKTEMNKLATAKTPAPKGEKGAKGAKEPGDASAPTGPGGDYTVKAGDGLAKIAKAHGVSLEALEAANPGVDSRKLKVGQKLVLPKGR